MANKIYFYNPHLKFRAIELRKNMTEAEVILWSQLRKKQVNGFRFLRQRPIGNYIVDFICKEANLVVEIDGDYHYQANQQEYDSEREAYLRGLGICMLHVTNDAVKSDLQGVLKKIREHLVTKS